MSLDRDRLIASVVVVAFNGKRYLENCLSSVLDQQVPQERYEVIVVDNNSSDGSVEYVEQAFPAVQTVRLDRNYGYYEAFNRVAASTAKGKYLIPLPQDTVVHRKWLSELVKAAECDQEVRICLVNSVNPTEPDFPKQERDAWPHYVYLMSTTRFGTTRPECWPFSQDLVPIIAYSGVSALLKRDILEETGLFFDSTLSHFIGDVDLGLRVSTLGYKVVLVPAAVVYHVEDNKSFLDLRLLLRSLYGARDYIVAYYRNMYTIEFVLLLPMLLLGVPLKALGLRLPVWQRTVLFLGALWLSPLSLVLAVLSFGKHSRRRKDVLSRRKTGRFWLLGMVLSQSRK